MDMQRKNHFLHISLLRGGTKDEENIKSININFRYSSNNRNKFSSVAADTLNYTVKSGDNLWKICVKHEVGVSEVLAVNPQITNADKININQIIKIPNISDNKH